MAGEEHHTAPKKVPADVQREALLDRHRLGHQKRASSHPQWEGHCVADDVPPREGLGEAQRCSLRPRQPGIWEVSLHGQRGRQWRQKARCESLCCFVQIYWRAKFISLLGTPWWCSSVLFYWSFRCHRAVLTIFQLVIPMALLWLDCINLECLTVASRYQKVTVFSHSLHNNIVEYNNNIYI